MSPKRAPSRFATWAWGEVTVLRAALVITYLLHVYFAAISFVAGVPAFSLTTFPGYTSVWATVLGTAAVIAAIGSLTDRWAVWERFGSMVVFAMASGYVGTVHVLAYASGDINRQAVAAALTTMLVLPLCRFIYLAAQAGKKKRPRGGA